MNNVLLVDDEAEFLLSLQEGLSMRPHDYNVITAGNGEQAIKLLESTPIHLVVTDLKMPKVDGFELVSHLHSNFPEIPVIVMTAFNTPEIETQINSYDAITLLEKPLDINQIEEKITEVFNESSRGHLQGITLPSFLQLLEMEKKTCSIIVGAKGKKGTISFTKGEPNDADTKELVGNEAFFEIVAWEDVHFEITNRRKSTKKTITLPLQHLLLEGMARKDTPDNFQETPETVDSVEEAEFEVSTNRQEVSEENHDHTTDLDNMEIDSPHFLPLSEEKVMSAQEKLKALAEIDGFEGAGIFTPTGEALAVIKSPTTDHKLQSVGVLANNVLLNAQKATKEMGVGRGEMIHVMADDAHILVRCLNEGSDPLKSSPGKAHIHLVLVLADEMSIGLAKMRIASVIEDLAEEFR